MPGHTCSGECDHGHDHCDETGIEYNLYKKIDLPNVICLNEVIDGSGRTVFKPWEQRFDRTQFVESDVDPELLFNVPFTGNVKLKAICIIGGDGQSHPKRLRLYKNKPQMTFDDISGEPDQEFELNRDEQGALEYQLKPTKFSHVHHLSLHFPMNFGLDGATKIFYIGLKGDFIGEHKEGVVIATYEARPQLKDHKGELQDLGRHQIS